MLWNFEDGIGEMDSLGTSSAGLENGAMTATSKAPAPAEAQQMALDNTSTMLGVGESAVANDRGGSHLAASLFGNEGAFGGEIGRPMTRHAKSSLPLYRGDQTDVKCPICLEAFDQPKVLACFHSFCKACLTRQLHERHQQATREKSVADELLAAGGEQCKSDSNCGQVDHPLQAAAAVNTLVCPLCHVETQLSPQLGIDGLLTDYGLMNAVNEAMRRRVAKKSMDDGSMFIFGSPSSTSSSSPPLDELCNQRINSLTAMCTGCKSGELANAYCCDCARYLCINCSMAHRYMVCFESHHVEELSSMGGAASLSAGGAATSGGPGGATQLGTSVGGVGSGPGGGGGVAVSSGSSSGIGSGGGGESSSGTSPPSQSASTRSATAAAAVAAAAIAAVAVSQQQANNVNNMDSDVLLSDSGESKTSNGGIDASTHCKCLEHRSQPLLFFCLTCNLAICRDCTRVEHVAPLHLVETIDNVAEKQIGQMEALIHAAHNKQAELHEIFCLIDADQSRLNASFQHAQNNVDESANCIIQLVQKARLTLSKELENAFGFKQLQLTNVEREVQKMVKKMSQTIEFTQRLLKYSSPTEVMVFKPLLDARIQGFLNFNADTSSFTSHSCEIETQLVNIAQARQSIYSLMSSIQSTAVAAAATASAAATAAAAAAAASATNADASGAQPSLSAMWPDSSAALVQQHQSQQRDLVGGIGQHVQQQQQLLQNHYQHQQQQQQAQHHQQSDSPSAASLLFYRQQQHQQNVTSQQSDFASSFHNVSSSVISRPSYTSSVGAGRSVTQLPQRSSPPMAVGSLGGGPMSRLASSMFDSFTATLSDSNLAGRCADLDNAAAAAAAAGGGGVSGSNREIGGIPISSSDAVANNNNNNNNNAADDNNNNSNNNNSALASALLGLGGTNGAFPIGASAPTVNFLSHNLDRGLGFGASSNIIGSAASAGARSVFNQYEKWSSGLDPSSLGALSLSDPDTITDLSLLANEQLSAVLCGADNLGGANVSSLPSVVGANAAGGGGPIGSAPGGGGGGAAGGTPGGGTGSFPLYPPRSQIKRQKMTYHCKFGEFGVMEGQFTEPSGVTVNAQNDIIVADTNNHRIQVFDKEGRFKFQFGECGKRDGQLLYPNRVSVNRVTGDFIVTERSPTHQIQIYNQYGHFVRKFGANILQHPRGVCVDSQGRIIVVECKVMRVIIFDAYGNVIHKFSCSRYLEFPNGVCTNDKNEILISDNRAHCIKVFNYEGHYVRQIGGEGITNYPIGVGINGQSEVIVADNHNNFNLTVFSQDGTMLNALESKVKHAQCFDVALVEDGSVVLASKDYRLYLYRYQSVLGGQL